MLRILGLTGLAALTLTATPAPSRQEVLNFQFGGGQFGCLTRGVRALQADHSVELRPGTPHDAQAAGLNLHVDREGLRELLLQLATSSKACGEQALYLLRPDTALEARTSTLPMPPALTTAHRSLTGVTWPW